MLLLVLVVLYFVGGLVLFFLQDRLIFLPEELDPDYSYAFDADFEELNLTMQDGSVINAIHFQLESPKGLIVYFHGNAGNLARWGHIVLPYVKRGYEVLIPDYRGYGKSTGKRSDRVLLKDAEKVYDYAKTIREEDEITLFGRSLGSTFASYVGGNNQPKRIILETPFHSLRNVAKRVVPIYPIGQLLSYQFRSFEYLQGATAPVYIFHGTDDEVVPYQSGLRLYDSLEGSKMFTIEGGHHNDLANFDSYWVYMDEVLADE
ncbi:MAG: alpha/beta hydrolase [Ekhidna sp.]|nr:alpha/beta hydrolase [Ekhidna sp.]